jgi:DNA-binding transcriptional MerR regulator/methylmalonyl-CoA mutase cobalamin-binding subunit
MGAQLTISSIAERTGLTTHTIRAWERRYDALSPERTATNRRLYTEDHVDRLLSIKAALDAGYKIGQIAGLGTAEIRDLGGLKRISAEEPSAPLEVNSTSPAGADGPAYIECVDAISRLDARRLETALARAASTYGVWQLLLGVVLPLIDHIEQEWVEKRLSVAQEHMASAVIRARLEAVRSSLIAPINAPRMIVTTPSKQRHELGALIVAIVASLQSWHVTYLGPDMPSEDIIQAVRLNGAQGLGLSLVYPLDDEAIRGELRQIRAGLPPDFLIFAGGRATSSYEDTLAEIRAYVITDLVEFADSLKSLRTL